MHILAPVKKSLDIMYPLPKQLPRHSLCMYSTTNNHFATQKAHIKKKECFHFRIYFANVSQNVMNTAMLKQTVKKFRNSWECYSISLPSKYLPGLNNFRQQFLHECLHSTSFPKFPCQPLPWNEQWNQPACAYTFVRYGCW